MLLRFSSCLYLLLAMMLIPISESDGQSAKELPKIDAKLAGILDGVDANEKILVSVVMKQQTDREAIHEAAMGKNKSDRRAAVVAQLKSTANEAQVGILAFLNEQKLTDKVGPRIKPLWLHNVVFFEATREVIYEVAARADVDRINDDAVVGSQIFPVLPDLNKEETDSIAAAVECGVVTMRAPEVWSQGITGQGSVVCVIDTGLCSSHPDLQNQLWSNSGEVAGNGIDDDANGYIDDIHGWGFLDNTSNIEDTNSHGTHVSGTVGGDGTNGEQTGMAPDVAIMTCRVSTTLTGESMVWEAMQYAVDNGADVITASLGWRHVWDPDRETFRNVCDNAIAAGVIVIYAGGNDGSGDEPDNIRTPGDVPDVITVGATDCQDELAGFSSVGPVTWQDISPFNDFPLPSGLIKPTIAAPGVSTLSTSNDCTGYSTKSGTSMSTPHVAGCVALMLEANPELDQFGVQQILVATAVDLGVTGNDNEFGHGRVDAFEAVQLAQLGFSAVGIDFPEGRPDIVSPNGGTTIRVVAFDDGEEPQLGTGQLFYDVGDGFESVEMTIVADNVYDAVIPASVCDSLVRYYVTVESTAGETYRAPFSAPTLFFTARAIESIEVVFNDDVETDLGWTVSGSATDGQWERGVPVGGGDRRDPPTDGDGSGACYLTDNVDGNSDVDGGETVLTSPVMDGTATGANLASISYYRWFSTSSSADDMMVVEISNDDGANWVGLETVGPASPDADGGWVNKSFTIADVVTPTDQIRLRFTVNDTGGSSIVEAGVDGVRIQIIECGGGSETVHPTDFTTIRGVLLAGDLSSAQASDDSYLQYNPGFTLNNTELPVWLEFSSTVSGDNPSQMDVTLEVSANTPGLTQVIDVYDWNSGSYVQVDSQPASFNSDSVVTVDLSGNATNYVEPGSGAVRTRVGWQKSGFTLLFPWEISLDEVVWNVSN